MAETLIWLQIARLIPLQPFIICMSSMLLSVSAYSADLLEIYHQAQTSDPTFMAARYALEAAKQKIPQARAGLLPALSIVGTDSLTSMQITYTGTPTIHTNVNAWSWSLQLTQPLIRMQSIYAYQESKSQVDAAQAQFDQDRQDLILRVSKAYFDVLVALESIIVADAQINTMKEQWVQTKRKYEIGAGPITDMYEAKTKLEQARMQLIQTQNDLDDKQTELERLTGSPIPNLAALRPGTPLPEPFPQTSKPWITQAENDNPTVRQQRMALAAAENEIARNRAMYLPSLDFIASYGSGNYLMNSLISSFNYLAQNTSTEIGVQLTIPLLDGGMINSKTQEARANYNKTQAQLEKAQRKAVADAKHAFTGIMNDLAQIVALNSAIESGISSVKGNQAGYQVGTRINSDVLGAEQQLYTSRRDLIKTKYDALLQGLKLKAAAGILEESDVVMINKHLGD